MNRKGFIIIGTILFIVGMILMITLDDTDYGNFIGGLVIGSGIGCLSVLFSPKTVKPKN
jgi:fucose permease